jgi:two-component system alkaline phosphatase synthesis response regulator PhoP
MIYYLEDDENIRNLVLYALGQNGLEAQGFLSSAELYEACQQQIPDLILLDIMLPGEDGISTLGKLRACQETADIPLMMLTAKSTEFDVITGLDKGADDYLTKPFSMMELIARINALLRRSAHGLRADPNERDTEASKDMLCLGSIALSVRTHRVSVEGKVVVLTRKEFELLQLLLSEPDLVFTRQQLLASIWGWDFEGTTRTVDVHIQTLRQKLGVGAALIETVRGVGYRACGDSS